MHRIPALNCTKCDCSQADFAHVIWLFPVIARYWQQVVNTLSTILSISVPWTPRVCLLNEELSARYDRIILREILILACKAIALKGIQSTPPSVRQYIQSVNQILPYEKLIFEHRCYPKKYNKVWDARCSSSLTITST